MELHSESNRIQKHPLGFYNVNYAFNSYICVSVFLTTTLMLELSGLHNTVAYLKGGLDLAELTKLLMFIIETFYHGMVFM